LQLFFPCLPESLGELSAPISVPNARVLCLGCNGAVSHTSGIICANFGYKRGHWNPCRGAWHARCYRALDGDRFPIGLVPRDRPYDPEDEDNEDEGWELTEAEKEDLSDEYQAARGGDHLMCPFQCDRCHFRNMTGRDPGPGVNDDKTLLCIRRACLDSFWSRRPGTVKGNADEMARAFSRADGLGLLEPFNGQRRGPFPLGDTLGHGHGVRSLGQNVGQRSQFHHAPVQLRAWRDYGL